MIDYGAEFANFTGAFPNYEAVNVSAPGAGDGTEFIAAMVNDIWGRAQALMDYAGLSPDGVQEAPGTAQIISAIGRGFGVGPGVGVTYWKNDDPSVFGDRVILLIGQVIEIATYPLLAAAVYCGNANNATAPAFFKTSDLAGTVRDTGGTYMVMPDTRGLSLKNIGDATINTRVKTGPVSLGEKQEDSMQAITGDGYVDCLTRRWNAVVTNTSNGALSFTESGNDGRSPAVSESNVTIGKLNLNSADSPDARTTTYTRDSSIGTRFGITY